MEGSFEIIKISTNFIKLYFKQLVFHNLNCLAAEIKWKGPNRRALLFNRFSLSIQIVTTKKVLQNYSQ